MQAQPSNHRQTNVMQNPSPGADKGRVYITVGKCITILAQKITSCLVDFCPRLRPSHCPPVLQVSVWLDTVLSSPFLLSQVLPYLGDVAPE